MKNFTKNLLGMALAGLILSACSQMATFEDADLMNEQAVAKTGFNLNPYNVGGNENAAILAGGGNCQIDCIDANSGDEFAATASSQTVLWGGPQQNNNSKTLSVKVWNTLTTIEYRFTITTNANSAGNLQYFDEITNDWINIGALSKTQALAVSRPLPQNWSACDVITEQWRQTGGGSPAELGDVSYSLISECTTCTRESFNYVSNGNGSFTFTYIPFENISDAELVFTFAQGIVLSGLEGWATNGSTRQKTMNLEKCKPYSWTITLDCKSNPGAQNLWTDFKVNDVSKKGSLSNIKCR